MNKGSSITPEIVKNTAHLARIELRPGDSERYAGQLDSILKYVDLLQNLDTDGIDGAFSVNQGGIPLGADEPVMGLSVEDALSNAPDSENNCFKAPRILNPGRTP